MKHEGFHKDRLRKNRDNPREVAFAEQWIFENDWGPRKCKMLDALIPDATKRDAEVAATIIQWLGSNVGMGFLIEAMQREPKIREYLLL